MTPFSQTLKAWRKTRRLSQLELAGEANVSSRHLSFLETGRAQPSRDMIARLGEALQLPLTARNQLLTQAGYATRYTQHNWDSHHMAPIRAAIDHTLEGHAPYPAFAVDQHWTILKMNGPATHLFAFIGATEGTSLIDLLQDKSVQAHIENWPEVAYHATQRLRTESAARGGDPRLDAAADALSKSAGRFTPTLTPVVPTLYRIGDQQLSLFSTIAQFGTPEDLLLDDLRIELFFPGDAASETLLRALFNAPTDTVAGKP